VLAERCGALTEPAPSSPALAHDSHSRLAPLPLPTRHSIHREPRTVNSVPRTASRVLVPSFVVFAQASAASPLPPSNMPVTAWFRQTRPPSTTTLLLAILLFALCNTNLLHGVHLFQPLDAVFYYVLPDLQGTPALALALFSFSCTPLAIVAHLLGLGARH
jgi:hypothetical protein